MRVMKLKRNNFTVTRNSDLDILVTKLIIINMLKNPK